MTAIDPPLRLGRAGGRRGPLASALRGLVRFTRRRRLGAVGAALVAVVLVVAAFSPALRRYDDSRVFSAPNPEFNPTASPLDIARNPNLSTPTVLQRYLPPGSAHWFGTDQFGRDIYARIVTGARLAVIIGIGSSAFAVVAGTVIGVVSGYLGGKVDLLLQRFVDALQAFPGLVLLMLIVQVVQEPPLSLTV
ncbi:MAG: hypothetical protein U0531_16435, partial [Dehalococcoidia bacterium]